MALPSDTAANLAGKLEMLSENQLFKALPDTSRSTIAQLGQCYSFTFQELYQLCVVIGTP